MKSSLTLEIKMTMLNSNFNDELGKPLSTNRKRSMRSKVQKKPPNNNKMFLFATIKLFNCLVISLAYFGFSSSYLFEIMNEVRKNKYNVYKYYQTRLYASDFFCWIIPLFIYLLWSKVRFYGHLMIYLFLPEI